MEMLRNVWMYMLAGLVLFDVVGLTYEWFGTAPAWVSFARVAFTVAFIISMVLRLLILMSERKK